MEAITAFHAGQKHLVRNRHPNAQQEEARGWTQGRAGRAGTPLLPTGTVERLTTDRTPALPCHSIKGKLTAVDVFRHNVFF